MFKRIPKEIKHEIINKVKQGGKVRDLAHQYGISDKTIYSWLRIDSGENVISITKYNKLKKENQELKRLIGELSLTLSLGKKIELIKTKAKIKSVWAQTLNINRKNIYRVSILNQKDKQLKTTIETSL